LEWKALFAFCRLVGPRVPSELAGLRWSDIDFVNRRIVLRSPKTKHHGGEHALGCLAMHPELVSYLQELVERVGLGVDVLLSSLVFPLGSDAAVNLRISLRRLIAKAGVQVRPKLFHNLRSRRETELLAEYSIADVCNWFGHSPTVAARFYARARTEVLERASTESTLSETLLRSRVRPKRTFLTQSWGQMQVSLLTARMGLERRFGVKKTYEKSHQNTLLMALVRMLMETISGRRGTRTPDIHFVRVAL